MKKIEKVSNMKMFFLKFNIVNKIVQWVIKEIDEDNKIELGDYYCPLTEPEKDQIKFQVELFLSFAVIIFIIMLSIVALSFLLGHLLK